MLSLVSQLYLALARPQVAHRVEPRCLHQSPTVGIAPCRVAYQCNWFRCITFLGRFEVRQGPWPHRFVGRSSVLRETTFEVGKWPKWTIPSCVQDIVCLFKTNWSFGWYPIIYLFIFYPSGESRIFSLLWNFRPIFLQNLIKLGTLFVGRSSVYRCTPLWAHLG